MKKFLAALLAACLALPIPASALELIDAQTLLRRFYVEELSQEVLGQPTLEDMLAALDDPYTVYLTAEEYSSFLSGVHGQSLVGVGLSIHNVYQEGFEILSVLPASPALAAGLLAGDRIIAVDGVTLTAGSDITALVGGEEGTEVTLTLVRGEKTLDYTLERRTITVPIVTYSQMDDAGFIDCTRFGDSTVSTIRRAIQTLDQDVAAWIMDLRSNPGGTANAAAGSASLFYGGGTMCYFRHAGDEYSYVYTDKGAPDLTDRPLMILTSAHSASGSELFSAAARDLGFGIAIGQRTYGKGVAQSVFDQTNTQGIFNGDAMKVTTQRFYSPHGTSNHIVGVLPTLLVSPEHTQAIAQLLSSHDPGIGNTRGYLKVDFPQFSLYVDLERAMWERNRAPFTQLLEALPPFCEVRMGDGIIWSSDGEYTPERVARELGLPFQTRAPFSDVDLTAHPWLETLAIYGLIAGYEDGTFRPQGAITRAEFAALVANALDLQPSARDLTFSDTPADAWYAGDVSAMAAMGFLAGYEDGTFRPNATITNEEAITVLAAAASWLSLKVYRLDEPTFSEAKTYQDFSFWAKTAARDLAELGVELDQTDGQPTDLASRRTAARLLYGVLAETQVIWGAKDADQ